MPCRSASASLPVATSNLSRCATIEAMPLGDRGPVVHARTAERVGADLHTGRADRVQVQHRRQVVDVVTDEVVLPRLLAGLVEGLASYLAVAAGDQLVRPGRDPAGRVGVGGTAVRRVVLDTAVAWRV